jgi:hypothetical protein
VGNRLIICGWYRDENAHRVPQLTRHPEAYRHQHDFVHVIGPTTKAEQAMAAMDRHPSHVIARVDADRRARGTLEELAHIRADVAMFTRPKSFRGRIRHAVRGNTIVLRPSRGAHRFVKIPDRGDQGSARSHSIADGRRR